MGELKIQAVSRAIQILNCFSKKNPELKLTDISKQLGINKSTVHGIIKTLEYDQLIEQNSETQRYRLGVKLVELGNMVLMSKEIRTVAKPYLLRLCEKLNETVHLGELNKTDIVYIDKFESDQSIRIFTTVGTRYDAFCTAIGKAILAYKSNEELLKHLPTTLTKHTDKTTTDIDILKEELNIVKSRGYATDREENVVDLNCIGAPIFNDKAEVCYSISVSGPVNRMTETKLLTAIEEIKKTAFEISREIGYIG